MEKKPIIIGSIIGGIGLIAGVVGLVVGFSRNPAPAPTPDPEPVPTKDEFTVSFLVDGCEYDGSSKAKKDEVYNASFKVFMDGYRPVVNNIVVGNTILDKKNYDLVEDTNESKWNLSITDGITDDVTISVQARSIHDLAAYPLCTYLKQDGKNIAIVTGLDVEEKDLKDVSRIYVPQYVVDPVSKEKYEVIEIKKGALAGCPNMTDLSIPFVGLYKDYTKENADVSDHMLGAVFGDNDYSGGIQTWQDYYLNGNHIMKKWVIPNDLSDVTITGDNISLDIAAFSACNRINDIALTGKNTNLKIPSYAFNGCKGLESFKFKDKSILEIGDSAFKDCINLQNFGPSLKEDDATPVINLTGVNCVKTNGFLNCSSAIETYIPKELVSIEENAFNGLGGLIITECESKQDGWHSNWISIATAVVYGSNGEPTKYKDTSGNYNFIIATERAGEETKKVAYLIEYVGEQYPKEVSVPNTVKTSNGDEYDVGYLGVALFYQYITIQNVDIQCENLISIGNYCFAMCYDLRTIKFCDTLKENQTLTSIGAGAFYGCSLFSLTDEITAPENRYIFEENLVFPTSVKYIGSSAFSLCSSIKDIVLPGVTNIGASAFEDCHGLRYVRVNADVASFEAKAFKNSSLEGVTYYQDPNGPIASGKNFTEISIECFKNTKISNANAVIPWYVETIREGAFENCQFDKIILEPFDDGSGVIQYSTHLKSIEPNAFASCVKLVDFDDLQYCTQLESLGKNAFKNCLLLTNITINSVSLTSISESCFEGCINLTEFNCNSPLTTIDNRVFYGCGNLVYPFNNEGKLPSTLSKIGDEAFSGCSKIHQLVITHDEENSPETLDIGFMVFTGWKTITDTIHDEFWIIDYSQYEVDNSNYLCIQKGWFSNYQKADTNISKFGWILENASSYATYSGNLKTERYKSENAMNPNLYIHIVD